MPIHRLHALLACVAIAGGGLVIQAGGQIAIPPSVAQQQAERKSAQSSGDSPAEKRAALKDQQAQLNSLRIAALGDDPVAALDAIHKLHELADPAKLTLRDVLGKILAHDRSVIESARAMPSASALHDVSEQLLTERKAARVNIDKLSHDDDTIPTAHKHYDSLKNVWEKLRPTLLQLDAISVALSRRAELVGLWHEAMPTDKKYSDEAEAKLTAKAEHDLGFTTEQLNGVTELGKGDQPDDAVLRDLWLFRSARRIAAYNATIIKCMSAGEQENFRLVDTYREYLGLVPFENDPRLVNSARDHSQEMITLSYFAHESPVAANKTPWDRIRTAGYERGSGENIAFGAHTGEKAFWMWFDSPGHHQNMAGKTHTAMGVGNVATHWTQNMGSGKRLMLATPEDRAAELAKAKTTPAKAG